MNKFSCMIDMVFGALRPGRAPGAAPATPNAVAFKNCRRDCADNARALVIATSLSRRPTIGRRRRQTFIDPTFRPITRWDFFSILDLSLALATGFSRERRWSGPLQRNNVDGSPRQSAKGD